MRKIQLLLSAFMLLAVGATAQVASSACIEELKPVYGMIDCENLFAQDSITKLTVHHSYIMRTDPDGKTFEFDEDLYFKKQFYYHETPEYIEGSDGGEAFRFQRFQFAIYRTKSNLKKVNLFPGIDKGIFSYCTVKQCDFIPIENVDDHRHKRALLSVNTEGQGKYQATQMEFVWDPTTGHPITIAVSYTDKPLTKWVKYDFESFETVREAMPTSMKEILMDDNGELDQPFSGSEVVDYR